MEEGPKTYDAGKYERPSVTVDIILFSIIDDDLKVLLIKRGNWPFKNHWALPGGFIKMKETLEESAAREVKEEIGLNIKDIYLEQLYTFGDPGRDPRTRVITVSYFGLLSPDKVEEIKPKKGEIIDSEMFSVKKLPELAFDHEKILKYALKRLQYKLEYTAVGFELLPEKFTLFELKNMYEIILGEKLDKRNFLKKINSLNIVEQTGDIKSGAHRPARLYKFKKSIKSAVFRRVEFEK
ncbi:MAG: NUDIX domain-containing protein [Candidatus Aenigmarchaeota archaeon]|nr:NUDIX domain-containing protein [Candidatus Aenigmarchaeota archaeon]